VLVEHVVESGLQRTAERILEMQASPAMTDEPLNIADVVTENQR